MKADPLILLILLPAVLLILFLVVFIFMRPSRKNEKKSEYGEADALIGAFNTLGAEIKSLKEQLMMKERLAALGEVSAGIAHEFRNPMAVIAGYARLLLKSFSENDERRDVVQGILREVEEMDRVMEELLKFTKSEPVNKVPIDLTRCVNDVIKGIEDRSRIDFSPKQDISIKGDETLLKQAVKNLIQNALDAGERVRVDIENVTQLGKRGVMVYVVDNGQGIPANDIKRIFMPFYTTKDKGAGIGLALVHKIVTAHGGNISVESAVGKGSTFRVFLPIE